MGMNREVEKVLDVLDGFRMCGQMDYSAYSSLYDMISVLDMPEWISVKDRPPEFYKEVNVAEHGVFEPWLVTSASLHKDGRFYRGGNIMIDAKFWQPLPEPPKEGANAIEEDHGV